MIIHHTTVLLTAWKAGKEVGGIEAVQLLMQMVFTNSQELSVKILFTGGLSGNTLL